MWANVKSQNIFLKIIDFEEINSHLLEVMDFLLKLMNFWLKIMFSLKNNGLRQSDGWHNLYTVHRFSSNIFAIIGN